MSRKRRNKSEALFLLGSADATAVLSERLTSRRWWCFIIVNNVGLPFVDSVERRYYSGKANRDFEMMVFPFVAGVGVVGIGLAKKRRLSVRQLGKHMDAAGMVREAETLARHGNDVIVLTHSGEAFQRVQRWLVGMVRSETAGAG